MKVVFEGFSAKQINFDIFYSLILKLSLSSCYPNLKEGYMRKLLKYKIVYSNKTNNKTKKLNVRKLVELKKVIKNLPILVIIIV